MSWQAISPGIWRAKRARQYGSTHRGMRCVLAVALGMASVAIPRIDVEASDGPDDAPNFYIANLDGTELQSLGRLRQSRHVQKNFGVLPERHARNVCIVDIK